MFPLSRGQRLVQLALSKSAGSSQTSETQESSKLSDVNVPTTTIENIVENVQLNDTTELDISLSCFDQSDIPDHDSPVPATVPCSPPDVSTSQCDENPLLCDTLVPGASHPVPEIPTGDLAQSINRPADEEFATSTPTRKKKGPSEWKNVKRKCQREAGQTYLSADGTERKARKMLEPCSRKCQGMLCSTVTEEDRQSSFDHLWHLSWESKAEVVRGLVDTVHVQRKRTKAEDSRRSWTLQYHLKINGQRIRVCRKMFMNTLALGDWYIRNAVDTPNSADTALPETPSKRSSHYDRAKEEKDFLLTEFFGKLPKLPSHYCRKTSSKLYLESHFRSLAELHKEYLRRCADFGRKGLGLTLFKEEFYKCNLALHQPRKDLCDICVTHSVGNLDDKTWQEHMQLKEKALAIKEQDKKAAIEDTTGIAAICMDLESVLLAPALQASALYYKTKLTVHNFTVYNLATKDVLCYVWHEGEGALTGNEFASCVIDYLENKVSADKIFIFSDGCVYQNKNSTLANAISDFCARRNKIVEHKYLIKGHTHMEVDSCHSLIERALKGKAIYVPHDYVTVFENARRVPRPFEVKYLDHTFFKDFAKLCTYKSIRPGRGKGDPQVNDIRCLKYSADRNIQFKLSFDDDWADIPKPRVQGTEGVEAPSALYSDRLKIPESKFKHLQELKCVLPRDHHHFYDNLRH